MKHKFFKSLIFKQALCLFSFLFCSSLSFSQTLIKTLEAEDAQLTQPVKVKPTDGSTVDGLSGGKYVGDNDPGSVILYANVEIAEKGTYEFKTYYMSAQHRSIAIKVNNGSEYISAISDPTIDWNVPPVGVMSTYIRLNEGSNTIAITPHPSGEGGPNIDKFEILTTDYELPESGEFPMLLEAEIARLYGDLKVKPTDGSTVTGLSGGKYIGDFNQRSNSYLQYTDIEIPEEGTYELKVFSMGSGRRLSIKVNQYEKIIITTKNSPDWNNAPASEISTLIYMDKGKNKITFSSHNDDGPNLDKFEIHQTNETLPKPAVVNIAYISDHTDGAEITAQHINETLANLTDNDENTLYTASGVTTTQITAKCQYPVLLTGYLFSAGLSSSEDVTQWTLEQSKDGNSWSVVTPDKSTDLSGAYLFEVNRNYGTASVNSAQYYRLTAKGSVDVEVAEWQLFGVPYIESADGKTFPADITEGIDVQEKATAYPTGASGDGWSEEYYNLFDRKLNTKYYMHETKQYVVEIELDKAYKLTSYTLTSVDEFPDRDPKKWTLNGYNDQMGWIELDRQTEFSFPGRYAEMRFNIDYPAGFTKFLLDVEDNNGSGDSQLLKWQLFGEEYIGSGIEKIEIEGCSIWSSQGKISILNNGESSLSYKVFDLSGVLITTGLLSSEKKEIILSQGVYIATISDGKKNQNIKVIVQ